MLFLTVCHNYCFHQLMYFRAYETGFLLIYPNGTAQNSKCQCSQLDVEWWQSKSPNKNMVRWKYTTAIVQWVTRTIKVSKLVYCVLCILCICLLCINQQMISQSKFCFLIFSYSCRGGDADSEGWVRLKKCSGKANSHQRTVVTPTHRVCKTTRWGNYSQCCSLGQIYAETMPSLGNLPAESDATPSVATVWFSELPSCFCRWKSDYFTFHFLSQSYCNDWQFAFCVAAWRFGV